MIASSVRLACLLLLGVSLPAFAADKKAEGQLRWGLTYCRNLLTDLENTKANPPEYERIRDAVSGWEASQKRYEDYFAKAIAIDESVTSSETVFDRKTGATFAQTYTACQAIPALLAEMKAKVAAAAGERASAKAKAEQEQQEKDKHDEAVRYAKDALWGLCTSFRGNAGTSEIDTQLAMYAEKKKKALDTFPGVVGDELTYDVRGEDGTDTRTTKTVGDWFAFCDEMMPAHVASLRAKEAAASEKEQADNAKRKAMNDKLRKEEKARYQALIAATGGDRARLLKSHGFLPSWPRNGDLKAAPVWKWEINITHSPQKCETYQFKGNKLAKSSSAFGPCP